MTVNKSGQVQISPTEGLFVKQFRNYQRLLHRKLVLAVLLYNNFSNSTIRDSAKVVGAGSSGVYV